MLGPHGLAGLVVTMGNTLHSQLSQEGRVTTTQDGARTRDARTTGKVHQRWRLRTQGRTEQSQERAVPWGAPGW